MHETEASPKTILVADDESHILNVVSLKLRNAGFRVVTATDGQEAYDLAVQERPDLLITDYHMPRLSGVELCQKMQADDRTRSTRRIMLSARGYNLDESDMHASGIERMLSKPFSPRQLLAAVNEVLCGAPTEAAGDTATRDHGTHEGQAKAGIERDAA
jgi:DNA-binding response OmpR family regulator